MTAQVAQSFPGRVWPWLALSVGVLLADQLSKTEVQAALTLGNWLAVNDFFNIVLAYNRGAAFSFLNNASAWQGYVFIAIALVASVVIVRLLARPGNSALFSAALGLIMGGALGNAIDRVRYGHVIDFLDFHWRWLEPIFPGGHFPAFNLADSAITGGVTLLILDELVRLRKKS